VGLLGDKKENPELWGPIFPQKLVFTPYFLPVPIVTQMTLGEDGRCSARPLLLLRSQDAATAPERNPRRRREKVITTK